MTLLSISHVTRRFAGLTALEDVSFDVEPDEVVGLIGPNGAGKSTLINLITGITPPSSGDIRLRGESLLGVKPHLIARKGIGRTFQHIHLFDELSVLENVMVGFDSRMTAGYAATVLGLRSVWREEAQVREKAMEILGRVDEKLLAQCSALARELPYADKRRLEIARALATGPSLLLLDEPAAGMAPQEIGALADDLRRLNREGMAVIVIEHKMRLIEGVTDKVIVLDHGRKIFEGSFDLVKRNPDVIEAYLGRNYADVAVAQAS
ncbi:ABC transporter ATP-binding protein [Verticiella sediminum]|uniref:ABC transporter ATP-binding protein n=1 Tax=Verticiella sediminum TaxID=1247510 RepID=A0A556ACF2_9BURK|nr:ABC transporter ATP-binding protein [Verticiella sediminum]TSH90572.1 ABC transporter ATP-binding protein [Verticiella sediminum]